MLNVLRPLLLVAALSLAGPAFAQDPAVAPLPEARSQPEPRNQREDAGQRVRQVEREGGRVLRAEPMQRGGRETYRIKVLTPEGRVRVLDDGRGRDARPPRDDRPRQRAPEAYRADPPPMPSEPPRQAPSRSDEGRPGGFRRH
jgi:hypothetical protein